MFWLGAAVSLCYVPGATGAYIATQWPLLSLLAPFAFLRHGPFTALHAAGLLFVAYAAVRLAYSPVPYFSVFGMWLVVIMASCAWFGTTLENTRELYAGLAVGAAASSFVAVLQYFGFAIVPMTSANPAGLYVNSVQQGAVLALIVVALISERMWFWVLPALPGIWLAHSRGAWLALAVGLLACYVRRAWVFAIVAAVGLAYLLSPLSSSDTERLFIWRSIWDNLTWFGWGPGVLYSILLPREGAAPFFPEYAHNDGLQLLFEYGVGALLPFAIFGYATYRMDAREWPVVVAFVAAGCYSMPLYMPVTSFLALIAVGHILRDHGLACSDGDHRRQHVVSRIWGCADPRKRVVPVASHHTAKG